MKKVLGLLCIPAGAFGSFAMYVTSKDGNFRNPIFFGILLFLAIISFSIFSFCQRFRSKGLGTQIGVVGSYVAFIVFLLLSSLFEKNNGELLTWMPVIVILGVFYMAPVVGLSYLGSSLFFKKSLSAVQPQRDALL